MSNSYEISALGMKIILFRILTSKLAAGNSSTNRAIPPFKFHRVAVIKFPLDTGELLNYVYSLHERGFTVFLIRKYRERERERKKKKREKKETLDR